MHAITFADSVEVGTRVLGKYRVESVLAQGGMAVVVAATHLQLDQVFALKIMRPEVFCMPAARESFLREAQSVARLKSEHVTRVTDIGQLDDGTPVLVMELLEGKDLEHLLYEKGPRPIAEAVDYMLQACEAVAEAHAFGIVHRDLKPANLFLTVASHGADVLKVLDFGIAKSPSVARVKGARPNTEEDAAGSPAYMSPEQLETPGDIDGRADIWSLGVTLYELLSDQLPFGGEDLHVMLHNLLNTTPQPPSAWRSGIPRQLDEVIMKCLERRRDYRHLDVVSLAEGLAPFGGECARAQVGRIARIATGMFRGHRLAEISPRRDSGVTRAVTPGRSRT